MARTPDSGSGDPRSSRGREANIDSLGPVRGLSHGHRMCLMAANNASRGGVGFITLLGLLFIGLKLAGLIDWAWWVVLAPIWGQLALIALLFVALVIAELVTGD